MEREEGTDVSVEGVERRGRDTLGMPGALRRQRKRASYGW